MLSALFFPMTICTQRTAELCNKHTAESFHLQNTQNQQGDAVAGNAVKFHWSPKLMLSASQFHQKSSTVNPVLSSARQHKVCTAWSPNRKSREKENLSEIVRIKPSIYACTVYDLSIKLKKSGKGILLSKCNFSTLAFLLPQIPKFHILLGVKWL